MKIKYKFIRSLCKTNCPNKVKTNIGKKYFTIQVGSGCCHECKHHVKNDQLKQEVECNYEKEQ